MRKLRYIFLVLIVFTSSIVSFVSFSQASLLPKKQTATLKSITYEEVESGLIVHVKIEGEFSVEFFELESPHRFVCQFSPVENVLVSEETQIQLMRVEKIRVENFSPQTARVIFDLRKEPVVVKVKTIYNGVDILFSLPSSEKKELTPQEFFPKEELATLLGIEVKRNQDNIILDLKISGPFETQKLEILKGNQVMLELSSIDSSVLPFLNESTCSEFVQVKLKPTTPESVKLFLHLSRRTDSLQVEKTSTGLQLSFTPTLLTERAPSFVKTSSRAILVPQKKIIFPSIGNTLIGLRYGKYFMGSEVFNQVYGGEVASYGFSISKTVIKKDNHNFLLGIGFSRIYATGESTVTKDTTKFSMIPISFYTQFMANHVYVVPYVGIGADLLQYKETSDVHRTSGSTLGYHLEGGAYIKIPQIKFLMFKLYVKLSKGVTQEENIEIDLGGLEFGLGLSFSFELWKTINF